ncbi:hypothetical protein BHM03_00019270 [Ensete ventricosum]|uniref:Uncharacterized protein n=1 Tax=Ensete ventricosum TaxID=4639 RepID=A0A445MFK0_ENSVE|nr:hypothetical protein BHM03_00019270 [Ensete ventricosum]
MHRADAVGNSPGVHWELVEGIGSLSGWHKRVHQKKTETRLKIIWDSRKACRDSLGDSPKGAGSSLGTCREITERRPEDSPQEYRKLPNWWELRKVEGTTSMEILAGKSLVSDGCTVIA